MDGAASFSCGKDKYRRRGDGAAGAPVLPMNRPDFGAGKTAGGLMRLSASMPVFP